MKVLGFVSIAFLANLCLSNAQTCVSATVITIKGDTLQGEIVVNDKKPIQKFEKIVFKDKNGTQKNYKPEKVKSYTMGDEQFVSLDTDGYPRFYKLLVTGRICLLEVMVEMQVGKKIESQTEYYLSGSNFKKPVAVKSKRFNKQLADWTKDIPDLAAGYTKEEFDKEQAIEILNKYNSSKEH